MVRYAVALILAWIAAAPALSGGAAWAQKSAAPARSGDAQTQKAAAAAAARLYAPDSSWTRDPIHVYYDGGDCGTSEIELEIWNRSAHVWEPHPHHRQVSVPSCQVEDAGRLLNELRWRCAPSGPDARPPWRVFQVYDPEIMSRCGVDAVAGGKPKAVISVTSPAEGTPVRAPKPVVTMQGTVDIGGRAGSEYDVVLLIDRAVPQPALEGQVRSARAFVRGLGRHLGAVRVAVISYPDASRPDATTGANRELAWSADPAAIDAALARLSQQPTAVHSSVPAAIDAALSALSGGRATARPTIVVGVDGSRLDASSEPSRDDALLRAAERAGQRGATLHWVALGGLAPDDPVVVRRALERAPGSFRRIAPQDFDGYFLADLQLPVAEAVWVELPGRDPTTAASLDPNGQFRANVPVRAGRNPLVIHARTSDGSVVERPFELVFDDAYLKILEDERARIREAQRKRIELRPARDAEAEARAEQHKQLELRPEGDVEAEAHE